MDNGAPSLVDDSVIYGQDRATVLQTITHGRNGVMPSWSGRLSDTQINMLALYVANLHVDERDAVLASEDSGSEDAAEGSEERVVQ